MTFLLNYTQDDASSSALERELERQTNCLTRQVESQTENNQRALVEAENNLRFAIGRYLHDNPQQQLQAAISLLREQAELIQAAPEEALRRLNETNRRVLELLNQADQELNLARREVLPADPRAGTLKMSLETYLLEDFPRLHPDAAFKLRYRLDELVEVFDNRKENFIPEKMLISLFVREALKNAYKHSEAAQVEIDSKVVFWSNKPEGFGETEQLPAEGYYLRLAVKDNGQGFDPKLRPKSHKLSSFCDFKARTQMLGGFSRVVSAPGLGTLWEIYLPLPDEPTSPEQLPFPVLFLK